jgi:hypothetical protein
MLRISVLRSTVAVLYVTSTSDDDGSNVFATANTVIASIDKIVSLNIERLITDTVYRETSALSTGQPWLQWRHQ